MNDDKNKTPAFIPSDADPALDARYVGFFECFNRGEFFEAHDVLEELWLLDRKSPNHSFFKGLIQLAGAFVHLQKGRLRPAAALFKLARDNFRKYPLVHERLDLLRLLDELRQWLSELENSGFTRNPLQHRNPPCLNLLPD